MRTYRWVLLIGVALFLLGWLGGLLWPGAEGQLAEGPRLIRSVGQLLVIVGAAGLVMVFLVRRLLLRRAPSPDDGGRD